MILEELNFDLEAKDKASFEKLKQIGFPSKKSENYRHINLQNILKTNLALSDKSIDDFYKQFLNDDFYHLVMVNQKVDLQISNLPQNIKLEEKTKQNLDKKHTALYLLSESLCENELALSIDTDIDKPLMILNIFSGTNSLFANNLNIRISSNAKIDILEIFASNENTTAHASMNRVFDIKNATLNYTKLNTTSKKDILNINNIVYLYDGKINICSIEKGSKQSINEFEVFMEKENSIANLYSIVNIGGEQNINNTITINQNAKNTHSNQIFKHILKDNSKALFNSKIIINKDCTNSSSHQNSQTILLDDNARIFNEPRMMIFTDELEASHGATVGSLDEDAINYMKLRGLSQEVCEEILTQAFESEITEHITNSLVKKYIVKN